MRLMFPAYLIFFLYLFIFNVTINQPSQARCVFRRCCFCFKRNSVRGSVFFISLHLTLSCFQPAVGQRSLAVFILIIADSINSLSGVMLTLTENMSAAPL